MGLSIRFFLILFLLNFSIHKSTSQDKFIQNNLFDLYLQGGMSFHIGSHQNRIGLNLSSSVGNYYANIRFDYDLLYTFQDFGYFEKSVQHITSLKFSTAFKEGLTTYKSISDSPFGNQYFYEFHYVYRYYFNDWNTRQPTGEIGLNFGHFFIIHENDLLAAKSVDKFRTAAMKLGYQDSVQNISSSFILWTGNKDHPNTIRINSSDFSRYGYFDMSENPFGKYSHGILSINYARQISLGNKIRFSAGYDHEKIRNLIQNKFMHDLPIWPPKWNTAKSRHVPMVDKNGKAYLYRSDQKLPKGQFYWSLALNPIEFY
jgi:hypothetical protein